MDLFDLFNVLATVGLLVFIAFAIAKLVVHYVLLAPLIREKLEDVENPDPDFDWDKYINWK